MLYYVLYKFGVRVAVQGSQSCGTGASLILTVLLGAHAARGRLILIIGTSDTKVILVLVAIL